MLYSKNKDKLYYNIPSLRKDFPFIVFNKEVKTLPEEGFPNVGLYPVQERLEFDQEDFDPEVFKVVSSKVKEDDEEENVFYISRKMTLLTDTDLQTKAERDQRVLDVKSRDVRSERDKLLSKTDWIVTKSVETGSEIPQEWREYRQALREITEQEGFPLEVNWPTEPE